MFPFDNRAVQGLLKEFRHTVRKIADAMTCGVFDDTSSQDDIKEECNSRKMDLASILIGIDISDTQALTNGGLTHRPRRRSRQASESLKVREAMSISRLLNNPESAGTRTKGAQPRYKYTLEEALAVWYLRTDLGLAWNVVEEHFRALFPETPRERPGLQCKFYR